MDTQTGPCAASDPDFHAIANTHGHILACADCDTQRVSNGYLWPNDSPDGNLYAGT